MSLTLKSILLAALIAAHPFSLHADLQPTGCMQSMAAGAVHVAGCTAEGATTQGTLKLAYSADLVLATGGGLQHGTLTLTSASGDVLVAKFHGIVVISTGTARGIWIAQKRTGAFAALPKHGFYTSKSPDQGAHISFDVRA
jgi:hypothetical protein